MAGLYPDWPPRRPDMIDQPVFRQRFGGKSIADPLRPFLRARDYQWRGFVFPDTARSLFAARQQQEDHMSITPGSFLLMISAQVDNGFPNDFRFEITDGNNNLLISNDWLRYMQGTGGNRLTNDKTGDFAGQGLPMILPAPIAITDPGRLVVKIVNLAAAAQNIRLALYFAEKRV